MAFEYETMSVGSRSFLVQSTKRANEQSLLRQRVKRGMSKLWELGRFRADSERAECAERSIIFAAVRVGKSIDLTSGCIAEGG